MRRSFKNLARLTSVIITIGCLATLAGCEKDNRIQGSGLAKTETRDSASFTRVTLEGGASMHVTIGAESSVSITADDNILPLIKSAVEGETLTIKPDKPIKPETPIVINVTTPSLTHLVSRGAGNIELREIENEALSIEIEGAGNVDAEGKTRRLEVSANGAGQFDLTKLVAEEAIVALRGAGSASLHATETLKATIKGVGRIEYLGDPKVEETTSGMGTISKAD